MFALDYISGSLTVNGQLDRENPLYSAGFTITVRVSYRWAGPEEVEEEVVVEEEMVVVKEVVVVVVGLVEEVVVVVVVMKEEMGM